MKIHILGPAHPFRGGLSSYNERMARELQNAGHEVTLSTFTLQYPAFLFPGKSQYSAEPAPGDLKITREVNSINPLNWIRIGLKIKKAKPDLLITKYWLPFMGPCFGTILRIAKSNGHTRVITIVHNMIPHEQRPGDELFTRYFVPPVDAFVAMSEKVLKDISLFDEYKPRTLYPHPLFDNFGEAVSRETALQKLGLDPNFQYILFFGFIRKYKGLDLLLDAFADPRFREKPIKLIIAGEYYTDRKSYDEQIERLKLSPHIIAYDQFIEEPEVKYYFCAADLVVQPYRNATQSGVTQIAYHFDKPMVVTDVGGLAQAIPHEKVGYVVPPNPPAIADAILRFFEATDLPQMQANIAIEKQKYSWKTLTDNINKLFNQIPAKSRQ